MGSPGLLLSRSCACPFSHPPSLSLAVGYTDEAEAVCFGYEQEAYAALARLPAIHTYTMIAFFCYFGHVWLMMQRPDIAVIIITAMMSYGLVRFWYRCVNTYIHMCAYMYMCMTLNARKRTRMRVRVRMRVCVLMRVRVRVPLRVSVLVFYHCYCYDIQRRRMLLVHTHTSYKYVYYTNTFNKRDGPITSTHV